MIDYQMSVMIVEAIRLTPATAENTPNYVYDYFIKDYHSSSLFHPPHNT